MLCSLCRKEIEEGEIFNLIVDNKIVTVCGHCWWNSIKQQPKGESK
jgi:ribosome-binding protein aMBF1 (putative translation factor)